MAVWKARPMSNLSMWKTGTDRQTEAAAGNPTNDLLEATFSIGLYGLQSHNKDLEKQWLYYQPPWLM